MRPRAPLLGRGGKRCCAQIAKKEKKDHDQGAAPVATSGVCSSPSPPNAPDEEVVTWSEGGARTGSSSKLSYVVVGTCWVSSDDSEMSAHGEPPPVLVFAVGHCRPPPSVSMPSAALSHGSPSAAVSTATDGGSTPVGTPACCSRMGCETGAAGANEGLSISRSARSSCPIRPLRSCHAHERTFKPVYSLRNHCQSERFRTNSGRERDARLEA